MTAKRYALPGRRRKNGQPQGGGNEENFDANPTTRLTHLSPAIVATDYIRAYPEQVRAFVPMHYIVLGTDGLGRSD